MKQMIPDLITLEGAIDLHCHPYPDLFPRLLDDRGLIRRARERGMRAVVLKCHFESTVGRAYDAGQPFEDIAVFGGIVLNRHAGGVNPAAVETAVRLGAKTVWMPTVDADGHAAVFGATGGYDTQQSGARSVEPVSIVREGRLTKDCQDILDILAHEGSAALATGHLNAADSDLLVRAALERGAPRVIIQHPFYKIPRMSIDQVKALTSLGALAELEYGNLSPFWAWEGQSLELMRRAIAEIGARRFVMISDTGPRHNPPPPDCLGILAQCFYEKGVTREELRIMMVDNPAAVLGL